MFARLAPLKRRSARGSATLEYPKPARCKVSEHGENVNSEIKVVFIKIGENAGFIETTVDFPECEAG
jgi:hypothetical protein